MQKSKLQVHYVVLIAISLSGQWGIGDDGDETDRDRYAEAAAFVQQLADEQYSVRECATAQLIEIGSAARKALEEGRNHPDLEIRYPCERILSIISETEFRRRLTAFTSGQSDGSDLPGWRRLRDQYGDSQETRKLCAQMQVAEGELMEAVEKGPQSVGRVAEARCLLLQQLSRAGGRPVSLGSIAAVLFVASDTEVTLNTQATSVLYTLCRQATMADVMSNTSKHKTLRKMVGNWIKHSQGWAAYQTLFLAMQYDLKEGLIPAVNLLENKSEQSYARQQAVLAVAKLGDDSHIELLETLLDDKTRCSAHRINNVTYESQIRDVALAAILILKKQDPKKFGFARIQLNPATVFISSTAGFENEDRREQVHSKYKQVQAEEEAPERVRARGAGDAGADGMRSSGEAAFRPPPTPCRMA